MRVTLLALAAFSVASVAVASVQPAAEDVHGLLVLNDGGQTYSGAGPSGRSAWTVGPFDRDAVIFLRGQGIANYSGAPAATPFALTLAVNGAQQVTDRADAAPVVNGSTMRVSAQTRYFLRRGQTAALSAAMTTSPDLASSAVRTTVIAHALTLAAPE